MTRQTILTVPWVVLEDAPMMAEPAPQVDTDAPEPLQNADTDDAPTIRPWAKPLLYGALGLAVLWIAAMMIIIFDGALFADSAVRLTLGLTGIPIPCLLAIAFVADPDHDSSAEETYWTWGGYPVGACTPSRENTLTGR